MLNIINSLLQNEILFRYLTFVIIIIFFVIASIEDIKKREVYDYLNYLFVFIILSIGIFHSIFISSYMPIIYVIFGLLLGFAIGSSLYYAGMWGGGDAKFLIGFSGGIYYLLDFPHIKTINTQLTSIFYDIIQNFYNFFTSHFSSIILSINIIFLIIILLRFINIKYKEDIISLITLFSLLLLSTITLYFNFSIMILTILCFTIFTLIFIADEGVFSSVFIRKPTSISQLKEGDRLDSNIKNKENIIVRFKDAYLGITKHDLENIKNNFSKNSKHKTSETSETSETSKTSKTSNKTNIQFKNSQIYIRKIIPYALLIVFDYILILLKLLNFNIIHVQILIFLFKFLFFSFVAGGIIAILILFIYFIVNFKKVKKQIHFVPREIISILSFFIISILIYFVKLKYSILVSTLLVLLCVLYLFIKISKILENIIFVSKKDINKIVPGDWVVEDVLVNDKLLYSTDDFKLGIEQKQIEIIKKIAKGSSLKSLYVKDGLAFLPLLFIGFILLFIF